MKKTFLFNFVFLIYMELVLHVACFNKIGLFGTFMLLFIAILFSVILTVFSSISKKEKINAFIMYTLWVILIIIFQSELIYYKIYESFFSVNGLFFISAVKGGFNKVLSTIGHNIFTVILLLLPVLLIIFKIPKNKDHYDKKSALALVSFFIVSLLYIFFNVKYVDTQEDYNMYDLLFNVNMPELTVKKFGLMASSAISIERKIFGFKAITKVSEDIFDNKATSLSKSMDVEYNEDKNINFQNLIQTESNSQVREIHEYFATVNPTIKNGFSGIFENKNVIFIMAESLDEIAIDKDLTPTLYKLKQEGIKFNNYFTPKYPASTADGEYMLEWGILPIIGGDYSLIDMTYNTNPYILPRSLNAKGYKTYVFHDYFGYYNRRKSYFSTLDFDGMKYCEEGIVTKCDHFHGSDMDMMSQTIDDYINDDKFFAYYITLSAHGSYDSSNFVAAKHISKLSNYNYPSALKYYLAANIDFDLSLKMLIDKLIETNKLDDTVIIISSDHSPYFLTGDDLNILSNYDRKEKFNQNRGSLIIYNSKLKENYSIDKYMMNIDVLPTLLNMLNINYESRIIIGRDVMASNNDGVVILPDRSWINTYGSYDTATGSFVPFINNVDDKYVSMMMQSVNNKYNVSVNMQYIDYYKYIFK